jgi:hypothetical protein
MRPTTRRSAWGNASGRSSHASTMLKTVTVAPIPAARVAITTAENAGARRSNLIP